LAVGTLCGFLNGVIVARFKVPAFIVTLAMMNMVMGVAYIYSGGRSTRIMNPSFTIIGTGKVFGVIPLPVLYMIVLIIIFVILLNKTKFGTYIFAVGGNREAAHLSGVPIQKVEIAVFTISGFLAAFAGVVLAARMFSGQPSVGQGYELDAIAACVLGGVSMSGGIGRISGTIFGGIVIGIISNGLNLMGVSSFWQLFVKGMIILIAVLIDAQKGKPNPLRNLFAAKVKN
jgi:ribose transport system permease protein